MKIIIITVFESFNYGSLLQARYLAQQFEKNGDVKFLDKKIRKLSDEFINKIKRIIKKNYNPYHIIKGILFEFNELLRIKKEWEKIPSTNNITDDIDCIVLGSDEIWNIKRDNCRYPIFWGANIQKKTIAYAPSINNAGIHDFDQYPEYKDYLQDLYAISVRDSYSKNILSKFTSTDIKLVLDPTLLFSPANISWKNYNTPYIAVYLFYDRLSSKEVEAIISFSKEKKLPLISFGQYISWCNKSVHSIEGSPFYGYRHAKYVVTNTFHGTAYAINYKTQFVSIAKEKKKVIELLKQFDLLNRVPDRSDDIRVILNTEIDYNETSKLLDRMKQESFEFIHHAMSNNNP